MKPNMNFRLHQRGMTLLELLVVVAIIASLAGVVVYRLEDLHVETKTSIAMVEMTKIKKALLQFERDTGRRPVTVRSPVDFAEFFQQPADLSAWNIALVRGWRGPYLDKPAAVGYVDLGDGLYTDGSGNPLAGAYILDVPAVADPFELSPLWAHDSTSNGHWYFNWISRGIPGPTDGGTTENPARGRPYALFDLNDAALARVVSFGPNGTYENGGGDDLVLCLYRSGC